MDYKQLGGTGLKVSELGLGAMMFGDRTSEEDSRQILQTFTEAGGTFIDTADAYGAGVSEEVLGRWLKTQRREDYVIATKVFWPVGPPATDRGLSRKRVLHAVDASLRRLGTDYIDLYQLYNPTVRDLTEFEASETLDRLKAAGKILHYGVTAYDLDDAFAALRHPSIESIQLSISLVDQSACGDFLTAARERGVAVIAASPLGEGLLTNTVGITKADESSHHTAMQLRLRRARAAACMKWIRPDRTLAQTALRFALALDGVSLALPSAVSLAQLDEDIGALETPLLTAEEFAEMRQLDARIQPVASAAPAKAELITGAGEGAKAVGETGLRRIASS